MNSLDTGQKLKRDRGRFSVSACFGGFGRFESEDREPSPVLSEYFSVYIPKEEYQAHGFDKNYTDISENTIRNELSYPRRVGYDMVTWEEKVD